MRPMLERATGRGLGWVAAQVLLMAAVAVLGPSSVGGWRGWVTAGLAVALVAVGAYLGIAGVLALGPHRTIFPQPLAGSKLVQDGVYGCVRHPLYTSVGCLALGWGLWWGSGPALAATAVLIAFLGCKSAREEVWLRERFPEYDAYARRVKRLIPWVY